ncbi:MAG TPA: hypothetical protein DIW31_07615 [Bacteroidales bacterium]|nr:hypothetical protein [Bacteroidales bacterium]
MTSKELTELIRQNTRIILPNFGAFLVKDGGEKGFVPTNVSFSPFLRYNDGMMEVYVAKSRGISKEDASKVVFDFVENIKNELLERGLYEIEGLGFLNRDQRGSLTFSLSQKTEKKTAPAKVEPEIIIKKEVKFPESVIEIVSADDKKDTLIVDEKTQNNKSTDSKPIKIAKTKATAEKSTTSKKSTKSSTKIDESLKNEVESLKQEVKNEEKLESTLVLDGEPEKSNDISSSFQTTEKKDDEKLIEIEKNEPEVTKKQEKQADDYALNVVVSKNKRNGRKGVKSLIYTLISIGILIVLFFLIRNYYFSPNIEISNYNSLNGKAPESIIKDDIDVKDKIDKPKDDIDKAFNDQTKDDKTIREQKEKEQEDAIEKTLIEDANVKEKVNQNTTSNGINYYIIAGSFKSVENAKNYSNKLKKSGFNAAIIIQQSGMNAVYIGSFSTREEANHAMIEFKSKLPNLWILKK